MADYRTLAKTEIETLEQNGCSAESWEAVRVVRNFDATRVFNSRFSGETFLGAFSGTMNIDGVDRACGVYNARLHNCVVGDNVLIDRIGSAIINYHISDDVLIEDVFLLRAESGAQFGAGVRVSVLNEAGGREVILFDALNAQIAYMQALFRHDEPFQEKLEKIILQKVDAAQHGYGVIRRGARIRNCGSIKNVHIGEEAQVSGAVELSNGTLLSCPEHPGVIGAGASVHNFIIAEGARVDGGATLENVYVGQATRIGNGFTAENALFFANCEGFNSEVNSIFAGPYSVTHHKSTLLIASLFSFYNAGSGSNQSNHMYKLGPVHQGVFERGSKTGSFSYVLLESHVPAFSTVIGKHLTNIDAPDLPFSYFVEKAGVSYLTPAINLFSVGTTRDENKWPARDRRKANNKRDFIIFDVFSPYTIEKMRKGRATLLKLYKETPREKDMIVYGGVQVKRLMLRKGAKYYSFAVDRYLIGKVMQKVEEALDAGSSWDAVRKDLKTADIENVDAWLDISGLLTLKSRIDALLQRVKDDRIAALSDLLAELSAIYESYHDDEWRYVVSAFKSEYGMAPDELTPEDFAGLVQKWLNAANSIVSLTLDDAEKEFADFAHIGFGLGFNEDDRQRDFLAVRGSAETNAVVTKLRREKEALEQRVEKIEHALAKLK